MPELDPALGGSAGKLLEDRGVEVHYGVKVASYDGEKVMLSNGLSIETATLLWTAGTAPNPLLGSLPLKREKGRMGG